MPIGSEPCWSSSDSESWLPFDSDPTQRRAAEIGGAVRSDWEYENQDLYTETANSKLKEVHQQLNTQ